MPTGRPKISAPFNPVHLTTPPSPSEEPSLQPSRPPPQPNKPSPLALSPETSPFLRPVSPSTPNYPPPSPRLSPKAVRNFSRPTTPQSPRSPNLTAQSSRDAEQPPSLASLSIGSNVTKAPDSRPRKSLFKEENLDSLSPTTGSATAHRSAPTWSVLDPPRSESHRRGSSASSTSLMPPSSPPAHTAQYSTHLSPLDSPKLPSRPGSSHNTQGQQRPPTPSSPSFSSSEADANLQGAVSREGRRSFSDMREHAYELDSNAMPAQHKSGLVSGERKRSMWERVGRRGS